MDALAVADQAPVRALRVRGVAQPRKPSQRRRYFPAVVQDDADRSVDELDAQRLDLSRFAGIGMRSSKNSRRRSIIVARSRVNSLVSDPRDRARKENRGAPERKIVGMLHSCACYDFTRTYSPGASPNSVSLPSPGSRAGTFAGACAPSHSIQSGHQEPGVSLAFATQSSNSPSGGPSDQYWYFGLPAGLTTPAIWPDPDRT